MIMKIIKKTWWEKNNKKIRMRIIKKHDDHKINKKLEWE